LPKFADVLLEGLDLRLGERYLDLFMLELEVQFGGLQVKSLIEIEMAVLRHELFELLGEVGFLVGGLRGWCGGCGGVMGLLHNV
jgi:hypothetical protein